MSTFYVIGTPIGNLDDITIRAINTLNLVDFVLCEDSRVTRRLLERHNLNNKQVLVYNGEKSGISENKVIEILKNGQDIALVTDAGTPGISDPGGYLISKIRETLPEIKIIPIPGPSALTSALSVAGLSASDFLFLGFLPHKKGRETLFKEISESKRAVVFYESTHRILKALESLSKYVGNRKIVLARELTKMFEEIISGTADEILTRLTNDRNKQKGEFVVIVSPK